ncbi:MAG: GNAT family N-acetyltransferase [Planctomycetes bacterium]|nr:GNAT family N-acetyltransferase [Planctomycetota bacterium]
MKVTIDRVRPEHVPSLARICFEAFGTLQERHHVQRDFDSIETAQMVIGMFAGRPDFAGFAAIDHDGTLLGSNFLGFSDCNGDDEGVAGVGPITVAPSAQGRGVGKLLMQAVMNEAARRGISKVRLIQEAINTTSLSLYTKLGFDWRDGISLIQPNPAPTDDPRMSPVTPADLPDIDTISRRHYHAPRVKEVEGFLKMGLPGFMLRSNGKARGYFFTSFLGHGFADTPENLAALVCHTARHAPPHFHKTLLPLSENELHRALLARGCTSVKLLNYMSTGEYRQPQGAWMPCIGM